LLASGQFCGRQLLFVVLLKGGLQLGEKGGLAVAVAVGGQSLDVVDNILKLAGGGALNKGRGYFDCRGHYRGSQTGIKIAVAV
jgi:hypothetical protein